MIQQVLVNKKLKSNIKSKCTCFVFVLIYDYQQFTCNIKTTDKKLDWSHSDTSFAFSSLSVCWDQSE